MSIKDAQSATTPMPGDSSPAAVREGKRILVVALLTCAAVRLYLVRQYYCISSDGVDYIEAARDFYAGNISAGLGSLYPPGYPAMIAAAFVQIRDWELTGQLLSFAFGVGLLVPLFLLLRHVFDERVAGLACLLAALSPFLARYAAHVRSESPYLDTWTVWGVRNGRLKAIGLARLICKRLLSNVWKTFGKTIPKSDARLGFRFRLARRYLKLDRQYRQVGALVLARAKNHVIY